LTVSSTGPAATAQHSSMGIYFLTEETSNNFPVYVMTDYRVDLYVNNDGYWSIWDPTTANDTIRHTKNNPTPSLPPFKGWQYYDSEWKDDEQLTVTQRREPSDGSCINDDRTRDYQNYTCTDHYDDFPEDCGHYNRRGFNADRQCCACRRPHQPPAETTSKKPPTPKTNVPGIGHPDGQDRLLLDSVYYDTNKQRANRGIRKLKVDPELARIIQRAGCIKSHFHSQRKNFIDYALGKTGTYAENVLCSGSPCPREYVETTYPTKEWMNSPDHRKSMLDTRYEWIGCSAYKCDSSGSQVAVTCAYA